MSKRRLWARQLLVRRSFFVFLSAVAAALLLLVLLPNPRLKQFLARPFSPEIQDRDGRVIQIIPVAGGLWREFTPLGELPHDLVTIFQKSEDSRFYGHVGVDVAGVFRALIQNTRAGEIVSGGSTISMQLARLVSPHERGMRGKAGEALGAFRLEARLSKKRILELWINSIPFGSQVEGVTSAARRFFDVSPEELSLEQILLLAVVPRRPATYDPRLNPVQAAAAAARLAERLGIPVSTEDLTRAAQSAGFREIQSPAPHFVRLVAEELTDEKLAAGTPVETTLDLDIHGALDASIRARVQSSSRYRIGNGAGIVLDNQTGAILAYVGSVDYFDVEGSGQIDGVTILRQPGSTLKPFLYALALENGFTAASILPDVPTDFGAREIYVPQNFNRRFNGPVRLRTALASSLNVPAVYTIERLGVTSFASYLLSFGFDSIGNQMDSVGTGLALGNAEVSLYELTRAFSAFVRDGSLPVVHWDPDTDPSAGRPVTPQWVAGIIRDILSDRRARVAGFGTRSQLDSAVEVLFKTGTGSQFNNIWAVGSSQSISVGVWMGNFGGETVVGAPGSSLPAAVVLEILAMFTEPNATLPPRSGVHELDICATSGLLATEHCPAVIGEVFKAGERPEPCTWHVGLSLPVRYPLEYQTWARERDYRFEGEPEAASETLRIVHPANGAVFYYDPSIAPSSQAVRVEVIGAAEAVQVYLNDDFFAEGPLPLVTTLPITRGSYELTAVAVEDSNGGGNAPAPAVTRSVLEIR